MRFPIQTFLPFWLATGLRRHLPVLLLLSAACVTPFDPGIRDGERRLVVEGLITDQPGPHSVRLSYTAAYANGSDGVNQGAPGATVYATDDAGNRINFNDSGNGFYLTSALTQGVPGRSYQLHIATADGRTYVSEPDRLKPVPPVDSVYWQYNASNKTISVLLDVTDPATPGDGYLWKWKHYEQIRYCKLSEAIPGTQGGRTLCQDCCTSCWDISQCYTCVNIAGDQYVNGNKIRRQPIASVDFDSRGPYYMLIEQRSLSANAFRFWNSVKVQGGSTGGPFDAAPAPTQGNIRNANDNKEKVLGFFGASSVILKPYWLRRSSISDSPKLAQPPECPVVAGPPPPCYPCIEDRGRRTPVAPPGWFQ